MPEDTSRATAHCAESTHRSSLIAQHSPLKVFVTGGAGYIGSHVVLALGEAGHEVLVLDNLSAGHKAAVTPPATLTVGDLADQALLDGLFEKHRFEAVMHFAGSIIVPESVENPLKYYHNNTAKSRALMEAAVKAGVAHFIFSSTAKSPKLSMPCILRG